MKYQKVRVKQHIKTNYLRAIAAGLLCSGVIGNVQASDVKTDSKTTTTKAKATEKVHCYGINACKGKSDCHTTKHSCSGKNTCKGQGWKLTSREECKAGGGTIKADTKTENKKS